MIMEAEKKVQVISHTEYGDERPLYGQKNMKFDHVIIHDGESALKECADIITNNCQFEGKYPFWHVHNFEINDSTFTEGARAALWYCDHLKMSNTVVKSPKAFREMHSLALKNVQLTDAIEGFWHCQDVHLNNVATSNAEYLFMHSKDITIDGYTHQGNYSFQYCQNLEIRNAKIDTKDAFWNTDNVTVYDSEINGKYLGWYSKNLRLVNCKLSGTQPLCYAENLIMENCTMAPDCDLSFERSSVHATIQGNITSVKNPISGQITADSYGEIILDDEYKDTSCIIDMWTK